MGRAFKPFNYSTKAIDHKLLNKKGSLLKGCDLIEIGLYDNDWQVCEARKNNWGPKFIRVGHTVLYRKSQVKKFIAENVTGLVEEAPLYKSEYIESDPSFYERLIASLYDVIHILEEKR